MNNKTKLITGFVILAIIIIAGIFLFQTMDKSPNRMNSIKYCKGDPWAGGKDCMTFETKISLPINSISKAKSLLKEAKGIKVTITDEDEKFWYYDDTGIDDSDPSFAGCTGTVSKKNGEVIDDLCMHSSP